MIPPASGVETHASRFKIRGEPISGAVDPVSIAITAGAQILAERVSLLITKVLGQCALRTRSTRLLSVKYNKKHFPKSRFAISLKF